MSADIIIDPESLSPQEIAALKKHRARLAELAAEHDHGDNAVHLRLGGEGEDLVLPPVFARAVAAALSEVADGHAVHMASVTEELTTQAAADLLNVSRPHLVKLLEHGTIPFRKVGTHRRVTRADVLAYKAATTQQAEVALQELADQAQELRLGYE